jgi:hypothetical protein
MYINKYDIKIFSKLYFSPLRLLENLNAKFCTKEIERPHYFVKSQKNILFYTN